MNKKLDKTLEKPLEKSKAIPEPTLLHHPDGWFHRIIISEAILSLLLILCFIGGFLRLTRSQESPRFRKELSTYKFRAWDVINY